MGNIWSELKNNIWPIAVQSFPPKSKFSTDQIPDLTGRVIIVTGGNTGVGEQTIKALLERNAKVYMASRSKDKADAAIAELKALTGKEAIFLELDLSSLASIRKAANEFLSKEKELHVLFNNAGVMSPPMDTLTADGYDLQFGTNVLGHFFFTELLIPALIAGKETSPDHHTRVITTSSSASYLSTINWDTFRDGPARRKLSPQQLYNQSKFANIVIAREVAKRYAEQGIISISCNPGNLMTNLQRSAPPMVIAIVVVLSLANRIRRTHAALGGTMPEALNYNGKFLIPWARVGECRAEATDPEIGERLWNWCQEQFRKHQRLDVCLVKNHPIALVFLPASDIPSFVGKGNVDLGITGQDVILEAQMQPHVTEVLQLNFGKCALQVQVPESGAIKTVEDLAGKRVVTSFEVLSGQYFKDLDERLQLTEDKRTKIEYVGGSVEAACALGLADGIVDLVESGDTMRAAGLHAIATVLKTEAVLIKSSFPKHPALDSLISLITSRIAGVVAAGRYVVCEYNILREKCTMPQRSLLDGVHRRSVR
ncbi:ATP phosphoribosyltransferase [Grifola frondosa]|uniref:ATP phosphoribosyltransferase n=1 Tax=Grifola frondosa TaxID=5627 RepID=A0A1C7M3B1_GRIFR|nr:ATP phosphoribosyltransferase [Grifola frondosa]